jgi:c-di-GMP-binding flagellar brake protein YcgR
MSNVPGVDRPVEQVEADITLADRGITVGSRVELVDGDVVVVLPSVSQFVERLDVQPGTAVAVYWYNADGQRTLPAEITDVDADPEPRWRLRVTGSATHSQRRQAVRGRVEVPVLVTCADVELRGRTLDLSEAGLRASFGGSGTPPDAGSPIELVIGLEEGDVATKATVVRTHVGTTSWHMSIHFGGLAERDQDRIRRRVFQALREERARSVEGLSTR